MNKELENYLRADIAQRQTVNLPAGIGGVPAAGSEIHIHYHEAAPTVVQDDPAKRSTMDDGVLAWFMPYFVVGLLSFILVGGVVGLIMALAVVLLGLVASLVQILAVAALMGGVAVLIAGWGVSEMRKRKEPTKK